MYENIHPSLRYLYEGHNMVKEYKASNGATVRIFDTFLPKTPEERAAREAEAWRVADQIILNEARRKYNEGKG